ncbi:phage tail protein [Actinoplanes sp. NPDC023714]|uniref:phage tail protein n=1 Tax=Actinoplanes sp. NPDC023714 TaxID=3154322 RepID=UPI0033E0164C
MPPRERSVPGTERYPYPAYNFVVSVTNIDTGATVSGSFSEMSGATAEVQVIEYRAGTDAPHPLKVRGLTKHANITLKRGVTGHFGFWSWIQRGMDGDVQRQQGYIALQDEDKQEVMRWLFKQAWPAKYTLPTLNAKNNEIAIETLELVVEDLRMDV